MEELIAVLNCIHQNNTSGKYKIVRLDVAFRQITLEGNIKELANELETEVYTRPFKNGGNFYIYQEIKFLGWTIYTYEGENR